METKAAEVTEPQLEAVAAEAYRIAATRWAADISSGAPTECLIESTDVFEGLSNQGIPCTEEMEQLIERALERGGFNALAAATYLGCQQPCK